MSNPIFVELTRGGIVESRHSGSLAITRADGSMLATLGDTQHLVFPRSAVKSLQAIPLLETGAADRLGFGKAEIALACASHSGTPRHVDVARGMLARAGLDETALGCGAQEPVHEASARALFKAGQAPGQLNNNCSGKHSGMLATCVHCGDPVSGYLDLEHPHQRRIHKVLSEMTGAAVGQAHVGIDGCSAPNWPLPLASMASAFARMITGEGLSADRAAVCRRITDACMSAPEFVAGPGRMDTRVMTALPGRVFMKTGAEGVYCGALPERGLGFAVKIDDGNKRASEAVVEALLVRLVSGARDLGALGPIRNWRGTQTGVTQIAGDLARALDALPA